MTSESQPPLSKALTNAYIQGSVDGLLVLAAGSGLSFLGHRYIPFYRGFSLPAKSLLVLGAALSITMIQAERYMDKAYYHFLLHQKRILLQATDDENIKVSIPETKSYPVFNILSIREALALLALGSFVGAGIWLTRKREPLTNAFCHMRLFSQGLVLTAIMGPTAYFSYTYRKGQEAKQSD